MKRLVATVWFCRTLAALTLAIAASRSNGQGIIWTSRSFVQRAGLAMAYDSNRNVTVLFGGVDGQRDTWELGAAGWSQVATEGPPARSGHAMAYDSQRHVVVLFGGTYGTKSDLGDTWEWNGTVWTRRAASGPLPRHFHGMAYDSQRGVTVLFGGTNSGGSSITYFGDTWEWNGTTWTQRATSGPTTNFGKAAMAYDSQRARTVLFTGDGPTWEWDGLNWSQRATTGPSSRFSHTMAYDSARHVTVLFGGTTGSSTSAFADTWEWNGIAWVQRASTGAPASAYHAMAFDSLRGVTVVMGGYKNNDLSSFENDAGWEWNGATWTQRPFPDPPARAGHAMAYDAQHATTILFGGRKSNFSFMGDTWQWDGAHWTPRLVSGPTPRGFHAMCYDSGRSVIVLFGGTNTAGVLGDTWEWNGLVWSLRASTGPPPRAEHALAYDSQRHVAVLFGGFTGTSSLADTWEWDGTSWVQRAISGPPARALTTMTYDSGRGVSVLIGGLDANSSSLGDAWEFDGQVWAQRASGPTARYGETLTYASLHGSTMLFGGFDPTGAAAGRYTTDLWLWDGTSWLSRLREGNANRYISASVYDIQRDTIVVFGGQSQSLGPLLGGAFTLGDTWEARLASCVAPAILSQPASGSTCRTGSLQLSVGTADPGASLHYQWQTQNSTGSWQTLGGFVTAMSCGATAYAVPLNFPAATVAIRPCSGNPTIPQHFQVRCVVTDAGWCSSTTSSEATYTICPADFNCSGSLETQDIFDLINAWFAASTTADFNGDGIISVQDIFDHLNAWFAGC